jgi:transcription elongation factor Elf1
MTEAAASFNCPYCGADPMSRCVPPYDYTQCTFYKQKTNSEPLKCSRPECRPVYIEKQQFVRCLNCGASGGTGPDAIELWNKEEEHARGE